MDLLNEEFNNVSERLQKDTQSSNSDVNSMNTLPMMAKDFNFKEITTDFVKNELL